jgi:hypothetical protein
MGVTVWQHFGSSPNPNLLRACLAVKMVQPKGSPLRSVSNIVFVPLTLPNDNFFSFAYRKYHLGN